MKFKIYYTVSYSYTVKSDYITATDSLEAVMLWRKSHRSSYGLYYSVVDVRRAQRQGLLPENSRKDERYENIYTLCLDCR